MTASIATGRWKLLQLVAEALRRLDPPGGDGLFSSWRSWVERLLAYEAAQLRTWGTARKKHSEGIRLYR